MDEKINELPFRKSRVPVLRVLKGFFNLKTKIMSTEKKLTAVEWLEQQTKTPEWHSLKRGDIFEQAKELEKQQIIDFGAKCCIRTIGKESWTLEDIYNKTFKK